jgi:hypothetical protein
VCVTHEMGFARGVANRILFMNGGEMNDGEIVEAAELQNSSTIPSRNGPRPSLPRFSSIDGRLDRSAQAVLLRLMRAGANSNFFVRFPAFRMNEYTCCPDCTTISTNLGGSIPAP